LLWSARMIMRLQVDSQQALRHCGLAATLHGPFEDQEFG
jgi:hypothetical protein